MIQFPKQSDPVFLLTTLLIGIYGLGLVRAWELPGMHRFGLLSWLSPLHEVSAVEAKKDPERSHTDTSVER